MKSTKAIVDRFTKDVAIAIWGWVINQHQPYDVAGDGTGPAWCLRCNREWPCPDATRAIGRRDALREETA